jgi:hypothetical protein
MTGDPRWQDAVAKLPENKPDRRPDISCALPAACGQSLIPASRRLFRLARDPPHPPGHRRSRPAARDVTIPVHGGYYGGSAFIEDDHSWELAKRLINDTGLPAADRVAGLLVLCHAQPATRIVTLTTSQVTTANGRVSLQVGAKPLHLPPPLDTLTTELVLNRHGQAVIGHTDDTPWLFPGALPGRHLSAARLGDRLKDLGIQTRAARNAALIDLAAQLPAAALAQLLGIHAITATGWTRAAGNTSPAYAAEFSRRNARERTR